MLGEKSALFREEVTDCDDNCLHLVYIGRRIQNSCCQFLHNRSGQPHLLWLSLCWMLVAASRTRRVPLTTIHSGGPVALRKTRRTDPTWKHIVWTIDNESIPRRKLRFDVQRLHGTTAANNAIGNRLARASDIKRGAEWSCPLLRAFHLNNRSIDTREFSVFPRRSLSASAQ